jgi:hypothetical protein
MAKRLTEHASERTHIGRWHLLRFGTLVHPQSLEPAGTRALKESSRASPNGIGSSCKDACTCVVDRCEAVMRIEEGMYRAIAVSNEE